MLIPNSLKMPLKFVAEHKTTKEIIVCPRCNGWGYEEVDERLNVDSIVKCPKCWGGRVLLKTVETKWEPIVDET